MTRKTNVILSFKSLDLECDTELHLRVKIDGQGFPYVAIRNEKVIISKVEFPFEYDNVLTFMHGIFDICEGQDELKQIVANPNLTIDQLSMKALMRVA